MQRAASSTIVIVLLEVAGQAYGLPITVVQDALKVSRSSQWSGWRVCGSTPDGIEDTGTIEAEGRRIPLIDLRERLGLPKATASSRTRMLVVVRSGEHWLGLLADAVGEIVEAPRSAIESTPRPAGQHRAVGTVIRLGNRAIAVLDADRLLPSTPAIHRVI